MPLLPAMIGVTGHPCREVLEDRWVMNYAASVLDRNPTYYDNRDARRLPAHPNYISHQEWEAISALHEVIEGLTPDERQRGVHTSNDTQLYRPLVSGDEIGCVARVEAVDQHRAGARLTMRIDTTGPDGQAIASSVTRTIFRGVALDGPATGVVAPPPATTDPDGWQPEPHRSEHIEIDSLAAHIFSECARDYSPIHTDIAAADEAGLPGLILHGTGTFAIALSSLTNHEAGGDPTRVRRFGGRLGAMVLCPSALRLKVWQHATDPSRHRFEALTTDGGRAIAAGFLELAD
ncbi:MAG: MaoC family dehydratase N-terminal domain-containing protein [Intrasporangium sp.]|uniref:FAS1-like dehydratase domain-containing protein n=1 Tax=Intrasporangium sp. TaxID=1925024 RepID=UPI002648C703|nr:MaoC family dehydratase N-terminal domain-containing protein [Intrasporangium sp.]MDN5796879.1 MaoC family dehydratase N-terminal domain-containing protein [Intrasporangium sp.]